MDYLSSETVQKQLKVASDLLPGMKYVYLTSPDKTNIGRAILWKGTFISPPWSDAQMNLEYSIGGTTYVQIRYHKHRVGKICNLNDPETWRFGNVVWIYEP